MYLPKESIIFLIGLIAMALFALWFFINRKRNPNYLYAFIVSSITTFSYALVIEGSIAFITTAHSPIYFTRWIFYMISCSFLMLSISKILKIKKESVVAIVVLNALVMLSGAAAAVLSEPFKWTIFILGIAFFIGQLYLLFENTKAVREAKIIRLYIFFGWSLFPVVFIFAPEGLNSIDNFSAAALYLLLDLVTKIIFYLHLSKISGKPRSS